MTTDSLQRLCDVHYFSKECMVANKEHPSSILRRTEGNQRVSAAFIFNSKTRWERQRKRWQTNGLISGPMTKHTLGLKCLMFTGEIWKLKTEHYILRLGLPSTLFRPKKSKTLFKLEKFEHGPAFRFRVDEKPFWKKNFLRRTTWFLWPSFSEIKTQYNQWLLRF